MSIKLNTILTDDPANEVGINIRTNAIADGEIILRDGLMIEAARNTGGDFLTGFIRKIYDINDENVINNEENMSFAITTSSTSIIDTGVGLFIQVGIGSEKIAVFKGYILISEEGTHVFALNTRGGSDMFVNGKKVADWYGEHDSNPSNNVPGGNQYPVYLIKGYHSIIIRVGSFINEPSINVLYKGPSNSSFGTLPPFLFHDTRDVISKTFGKISFIDLRILSNTNSSSVSSGAFIVAGGVGIGGTLYTGGINRFTNNTASTSTTTGALTVAGGVGIAGNLNVGERVDTDSLSSKKIVVNGDVSTMDGLLFEAGYTNKQVLENKDILKFSVFKAPEYDLNSFQVGTSATVFIEGAPSDPDDFDFFTNNYSLYVQGGDTRLGDRTEVNILQVNGVAQLAQNTSVLGNFTAQGLSRVNNTSASTGTTTGALVVSGGVGIAGALNVGGNLNVTGTLSGIAHSNLNALLNDDHTQYALLEGRTGGQTLTGGDASGNTLVLRSTSNVTKGNVLIDETTASTSTTTGALVVSGGVGIGGALQTGGINRFTNNTASTSTTTGALVVSGGVGIDGALNTGGRIRAAYQGSGADSIQINRADGQVGLSFSVLNDNRAVIRNFSGGRGWILLDSGANGIYWTFDSERTNTSSPFSITNGTVSTSTTTGAFTVAGGVGIGGTLYTGGINRFTNATVSTSTTTGALVVSGGVGIAGALNVGGNLNVTGTLSGIAHSNLNALLNDDHTQYALLEGRTGGQTLTGGDASGNTLVLRSTSNATKGSVLIDETTVSTSTTTGALVVSGGVGVAGALNVGGLARITNTTQSTTGANGSLVVSGGLGVGGNFNADGNISSFNTGRLRITSFNGANYIQSGSTNYSGSAAPLRFGETYNGAFWMSIDSTRLNITPTTASTSTTTGALVVSGGVGIGGALNVNGPATFEKGNISSAFGDNQLLFGFKDAPRFRHALKTRHDSLSSGVGNAFDFFLWQISDLEGDIGTKHAMTIATAGVGIGTTSPSRLLDVSGTARITGVTEITNTSASTGTTTGALVVSGGVGIAGAVNIGGGISMSNNTPLTFPNSGDEAPTTTNRSSGTKIVLWPQISSTLVDYALGIQSASLWYSVPGSIHSHRFYHGTTNTMTLSSSALNISPTTASTSTTTGALTVAGGVGIGGVLNTSKNVNIGPLTIDVERSTTNGVDYVIPDNGFARFGSSGININETSLIIIGKDFTGGNAGSVLSRFRGHFSFSSVDGTSATEIMRVNSSGIGIGTTSPSRLLDVSGTARITGVTEITNTTASTSTTTGALVVSGGVGIGGALNVGGLARITNTTQSTTGSNGSLVVSGGLGVGGNFNTDGSVSNFNTGKLRITFSNGANYIQSGSTNYSGSAAQLRFGETYNGDFWMSIDSTRLNITPTTASTGTTTGALVVSGGVGIAGALNVGANVITGTQLTIRDSNSPFLRFDRSGTGNFDFEIGMDGNPSLFFRGGANGTGTQLTNRLIIEGNTGVINIPTNIAATSTTSGVLTVAGGVGVAGALYTGGINRITNTTASTSTTTGALTVAGGVGVAGALQTGATSTIRGNLLLGGSSTSNYIAFRGTTGDGDGTFDHTFIGERIYEATEKSELLLLKGNDAVPSTGPDRIRLVGGELCFDTYTSAFTANTFETVAELGTRRMTILSNGNVGIGTSEPDRIFHIQSVHGVLRLDRNTGTTGIQLHRFPLNDFDSSPLKGFILGVDAVGVNDGEFSIGDYGTAVSGGFTKRLIITNEGVVKVTNTTVSTSTTTGALTVAGGVGVAGALYTGGINRFTNTAASTSTTTGALTVAGGISSQDNIVSKNIFESQQSSLAYEDQSLPTLNTGTLINIAGSAPIYVEGEYIQLTSNQQNQRGAVAWQQNPGNSIYAEFDLFYGGGSNNSDATGFGFYQDTVSGDAYSNQNGIYILFTERHNQVRIYSPTEISTVSTLSNHIPQNAWRKVIVTYNLGKINVYIENMLVGSRTIQHPSDVSNKLNSFILLKASNGSDTNFHRVRNITIKKNVLDEDIYIPNTNMIIAGGRIISPDAPLNIRDSGGNCISFYFSLNKVGSITSNSNSTSYNTSSDYRIKENTVPISNSLDRIKQLPVYRFNFINEPDRIVDGFLAHEVADVVPEAVHGEKDAVDDKGNIILQGIDQSKLVPLLFAAVKDLVAELESVKSRLIVLESLQS